MDLMKDTRSHGICHCHCAMILPKNELNKPYVKPYVHTTRFTKNLTRNRNHDNLMGIVIRLYSHLLTQLFCGPARIVSVFDRLFRDAYFLYAIKKTKYPNNT